jgi:hypothetical protein
MSAELYKRISEEDAKMFRSWIDDLESVISEREIRVRALEQENRELRRRIQDLLQRITDLECGQTHAPVNVAFEFTETPGTYVPASKATEAQMRLRKAMLQIDAATIADWEATEQALRRAAEGLPPSDVDDSNSKQDSD